MNDNNNQKALKSGMWYMASNFLIKSFVFITMPIFTRLLTKAEFGAFNNYISWLSIATIFVTLNLESTLISARYDFQKSLDEYILTMLFFSTTIGCAWILVVNLFSGAISSFAGLDITYINGMILYLIFLSAVNLFQARERYFFEYKRSVLLSALLVIGTTSLSVLLVYVMDDKLTGRIMGSIIPTILIGAALIVFFVVKGKQISLGYIKYAIPICLPFIPHLLSMNLLNATDRIIIDKWYGNEATGIYGLAYLCGSIVSLIVLSMNSAFAPWIGEKLFQNRIEDIRKVSRIYICIFGVLSIGIMLISPELLYILGGKGYSEAIYVMPPVSMGCVCQFLYTMFVNVEQFKKKTLGMAGASMIAALINLVLNLIFIPIFGYYAAAYATLIGYICLLLLHMLLVKKIGFGQAFDYRFIVFYVALGIVFMILITYLYSLVFLRYIIVVLYCSIVGYFAYRNRYRIQLLIKKKG